MKKTRLYLAKTGSSQKILEANFSLLKLISNNNFKKIIEFGVGYGNFAKKVVELFKPEIYVGIDVNEQVKEHLPQFVNFLNLDLNTDKIPYPNEYFDLGIAIEVIEHLADPDNLLSETSRLIKKNGYFLISTPNLASWINRLLFILGVVPIGYEISWKYRIGDSIIGIPPREYNSSGHLKLYTYHALLEHLSLYNFVPIKTKPISYDSPFANKNLSRFFYLISKIFSKTPSLSEGFAVLAKKV